MVCLHHYCNGTGLHQMRPDPKDFWWQRCIPHRDCHAYLHRGPLSQIDTSCKTKLPGDRPQELTFPPGSLWCDGVSWQKLLKSCVYTVLHAACCPPIAVRRTYDAHSHCKAYTIVGLLTSTDILSSTDIRPAVLFCST